MARFLFTMLPANDLGLPTRMVPIARALADRGHEVAVFNPAPAPSRLIAEAGLTNLPMPSRPMPAPAFDLTSVAEGWTWSTSLPACTPARSTCATPTAVYVDLLRDYAPDMVVDSFEPIACLAARVAKVPLATVLQGNIHPVESRLYVVEDERPAGLPSAAAHFRAVAQQYELAPAKRIVDWIAGDLALIVGTPETDPVAADAEVTASGRWCSSSAAPRCPRGSMNCARKMGTAAVGRSSGCIPGTCATLTGAGPCDSIVVIRAAIAALAGERVDVVLTTGYQELPAESGTLPQNFHHAAYVPGPLMAERCDLIVFHGGHSSVMTTLKAATRR